MPKSEGRRGESYGIKRSSPCFRTVALEKESNACQNRERAEVVGE